MGPIRGGGGWWVVEGGWGGGAFKIVLRYLTNFYIPHILTRPK